MATTSIYLNFPGETEAAFNFYKTVFGTAFDGDGFNRFGDMPPQPDMPQMSDSLKNQILHVSLPILGGVRLMGSDAPAEMGFSVNKGNNMYVNLETDSREESDRLFALLSEGGTVEMPLGDMFWGAYFGSLRDKFGVQWMINCAER